MSHRGGWVLHDGTCANVPALTSDGDYSLQNSSADKGVLKPTGHCCSGYTFGVS